MHSMDLYILLDCDNLTNLNFWTLKWFLTHAWPIIDEHNYASANKTPRSTSLICTSSFQLIFFWLLTHKHAVGRNIVQRNYYNLQKPSVWNRKIEIDNTFFKPKSSQKTLIDTEPKQNKRWWNGMQNLVQNV